jgi:hypothetical protein
MALAKSMLRCKGEPELRPLPRIHAEAAEQAVSGARGLLEVADRGLHVARALVEVAVEVTPGIHAADTAYRSSGQLDRRLVGCR